MAFWTGGAGFSCWQAIRAWRDPDYARAVLFFSRSSNPAVRRGHVRGLVPFAALTVSIGMLVFAGAAGTVVPGVEGSRWIALGALALFFLCLGLHFAIVWFNQPRFLVLPHMRDEIGTVTEWWRWRRDIRIALKEAAERDALGQRPDPR